jgi:hypothetical protein
MQSAILGSALAAQNIFIADVRRKHVSVVMMNQVWMPRLSLSNSHCLSIPSVVIRRLVFASLTCRQ